MDGMSAFGLEASKATMFADTLAKASTSTNTDVAGLGKLLPTCTEMYSIKVC